MASPTEINLGSLPIDIIRKTIPLDQTFEVTEGLRLISKGWNQTVVEYLANELNRCKLPTLEHFHWKINNVTRKSSLSLSMSKSLTSYFGVQSWPNVHLDSVVNVEEGRKIELLENCGRLQHNISRLFRRCSRVKKIKISLPINLIVSNLQFIVTATKDLTVDEFAFTQLENLEGIHYITKPFFTALLPFVRDRPCKVLRFSANHFDVPHYSHFLKKALSYVATIIIECISSDGSYPNDKNSRKGEWMAYVISLNNDTMVAEFSYDVLDNERDRLRITAAAK